MLVVLLSLKVNTNSVHAGEVLKEKIAPADVYALLRNRNSGPSACMWQVWRG
jgi:OHS family lactose permease-like MFS transporter